ncbi:AraC family transcriptional regulator [Chromohalobacter japonicus]|uniref:AraC family transcriptional regulator n=1 Tax=Chromohalobacter japonicus TaxID=223900 RepID=UPI001C37813F|nr:AraC family transcriptional regulator [Chromohalobacter japonicus]
MLAAVYDPMINLILQGSKTMTVGDRTLRYDPATYFVMSIELPAVGTVHPAASGEPYLALSLTLDPTVLSTLLTDLPSPTRHDETDAGFSVAATTSALMDAWLRMLRLMGKPDEIVALAPVYEREILYRVLQGPTAGCCATSLHRIPSWRASVRPFNGFARTSPSRSEWRR